MPIFSSIVCIDSAGGIARDGHIPWKTSSGCSVVSAAPLNISFETDQFDRAKHFAHFDSARDDFGRIAPGIASTDEDIAYVVREDRRFFLERIAGKPVIVGRATYEQMRGLLKNQSVVVVSRGTAVRPSGTNSVVSDNAVSVSNTELHKIAPSLESAVTCFGTPKENNHKLEVFVLGGVEIYDWFLRNKLITYEYITQINKNYNCDKHYPRANYMAVDRARACTITEMRTLMSGAGQIVKITHRNREEIAALRLMREILGHGSDARDRTGVGTKHLFAKTLEFDLTGGSFPLFTSKRTWLPGLFEELMLYCRGQTNSKILEEKKINVWQPNTTREFLDRRGLNNLPEGDMGASYGFQMRHYGAEYKDCNTNYVGQGFDQLHALIANMRARNTSAARRLIINLWNPAQEHLMALPPCLYQYQFFIDGDDLSCMATQRSSDVATALGWNIAQIALLTILIAKTCDLRPKKITWVCGDAHIYSNLQNQALEQLSHEPFLFPVLELVQKRENIEDYQFADLRLFNYNCFPPIKGVVNV